MICRFAPAVERRDFTLLDNGFIMEYLPHASGIELQVYLLGLMQCHHPEMSVSIAEILGVPEQEVVGAFCYWQTQKLVRIQSDRPLSVEYLAIPKETAESVLPAKYGDFIAKLNTLTAPRQFSARELSYVYDWIEVYGLDEGAVLELVAYCMEKRGRKISVNYMNTVAQSWSEEGIRTLKQARDTIEKYDLSKHGASAVLKQWNKRRKPTRDEMSLYEKWTSEWGFTDEAIQAVLPRLSASGSPNFVYLDEMLDELRQRNLTGENDIREDDERSSQERAFVKMLFDRAGKQSHATAAQRAQIAMFLDEYKMPRELLLYAAECSREAPEPFGRMKILLNEWHEKGISTLAEAERYHGEQSNRNYGKRKSSAYEQHEISDVDFSEIFLDLDKELHEG